jgi:uncharacterized membrane protein
VYRAGSGEFSRVVAFSDGVFAIAMTLLVIGVVVPTLSDPRSVSELAEALNDLLPNIISFFISFAVIGRYWMAHHGFFGRLGGVDRGLIGLNLVYLAFIAFLPFPTALLGEFFENPLSVAVYAVAVAIVSGLEVVMFRHAQRHDLMRETIPWDVYRWGVVMSLSPVLFFLISVPIAFLNTTLAVAAWALMLPFQMFANRYKPEGADRYLWG